MSFTKFEKDSLFNKYNINLENVGLEGNLSSEEDKEKVIYYLLEAFELARKNELKGNITGSSYACGLILEDNSVYFGINFNNTRNEISGICAERLAILEAFSNKVKDFDSLRKEKFGFKIKYILMSSYKEENKFWIDKITPCADCLSWFNTGNFLAMDTKICSLNKDSNGKIILDIQELDKFLPLRNLSYNILDNVDFETKITKSDNAKKSNLLDEDIINLYKKCYAVYKNNKMAQTSGQNIAAAIISNNEIFTGAKIDYSKRWFTEPLELAVSKAVEKFGDKTKIEAICYIGEEYTTTESKEKVKDGFVSIQTLGRISTKFADDNTLVITSSKSIDVRTIGDYMPSEHKFIHTYKIK